MKDIAALLRAAEGLGGVGDEAVLVTLVKTVGSTYRRAGARMLVLPGCRTVGTISGGCLEGMVAREAWAATRGRGGGKGVVLEVESATEDDSWGPASGCHGTLFLLAEGIGKGERHPVLGMLAEIRAGDRAGMIVHEFEVGADGGLIPGEVQVETDLPRGVVESAWREGGGRAAFRECILPVPHLLICGAGDDAIPVARIAGELGWRISVVDSRGRLATQERFGVAAEVSAEGAAAVRGMLRRNTAAVVMSHRFGEDVEYVTELLKNDGPYVGLLGPRRRAERVIAELVDRGDGAGISAERLARVFSPVGLNLGAEGAEAIALSIVAEIQAVLAGRDGLSLSEKEGPMRINPDYSTAKTSG